MTKKVVLKRQEIKKKKQPIIKRIGGKKPEKKVAKPTRRLPNYKKAGNVRTRICVIQTGSWGDNINSTLMFKPLLEKFTDCTIDVHTSTYYASAFRNNSYINKLIEYEADTKNDALHLTLTIDPHVQECGYDLILSPHPMFNPDKWSSLQHPDRGDNIIYAWVRALEENDVPYTFPLETIMELDDEEISNVDNFLASIENFNISRNILMEVHGESGQTFWDPTWTVKVGKYLLDDPKTNLFVSRKNDSSDVKALSDYAPGRVFFVGGLSIRECGELFNRCYAFFSVSSGLSNACNTNWCRNDVKWFETVNSTSVTSAPIREKGKVFWLENDQEAFIKMLDDKL